MALDAGHRQPADVGAVQRLEHVVGLLRPDDADHQLHLALPSPTASAPPQAGERGLPDGGAARLQRDEARRPTRATGLGPGGRARPVSFEGHVASRRPAGSARRCRADHPLPLAVRRRTRVPALAAAPRATYDRRRWQTTIRGAPLQTPERTAGRDRSRAQRDPVPRVPRWDRRSADRRARGPAGAGDDRPRPGVRSCGSLADEEVSRLHAELVALADGWAISDDGLSRNGTYVNAERLGGSPAASRARRDPLRARPRSPSGTRTAPAGPRRGWPPTSSIGRACPTHSDGC